MLEHVKGVIFDLDGSLVDSMWIWVEMDHEYIKDYHLTVPEHFYEEMEGMSFTETAQYFVETFPELNRTAEEMKEEWVRRAARKYCTEVKLKKGAFEFLQLLKQKGIPAGIATSNGREIVEGFLEANGLTEYFQTVWTSCDVNAGKPAPDVYLKAAESLGVAPEHCLVFEDVPKGIQAGKNAGMHVCAVEDAFSAYQDEKKRELADYYIHDYYEMINQTYEVL